MTVRDVLGGAVAAAAAGLLVLTAGNVIGAAAISLSDLVAPCGDVSPVHHDDRNAR